MDRNLYEYLCKIIDKMASLHLNPVEREYFRDLCFLEELWMKEPLSFISKKIIKDRNYLHCFLIPYRLQERVYILEEQDEKEDKHGELFSLSTADNLAFLLNDFIDYVCALKGHKIGVGEALIRRYIQDRNKKE